MRGSASNSFNQIQNSKKGKDENVMLSFPLFEFLLLSATAD